MADELQIWRAYGQPTLAAYLEQTLGYTPHACSERLRVARELRELPQLHAALAAGRLHFSAVRELTRVATRDTEDSWIAEAAGKTVRQVEQAVAGHIKGDLPTDPADPDTALRHVGFDLTPATIAAFRAIRKQLDAEVGERLTDDQLFQILARRALEPATGSSGPASQMAFMVCPTCKAGTADGAGMIADVTPVQLETALCDAELLGNVEHEPERVRKTITAAPCPAAARAEISTCTTFSSSPTWDATRFGTSPYCAAPTTGFCTPVRCASPARRPISSTNAVPRTTVGSVSSDLHHASVFIRRLGRAVRPHQEKTASVAAAASRPTRERAHEP